MEGATEAHSTSDSPDTTAPLPNVFVRWAQVFVSPGRLFESLRERPEWGAALLLAAGLVAASFLLIPVELAEQVFREQILASGSQVPAGFDIGRGAMIAAAGGYAVMTLLWSLVFAGLITLVFGFLLGDDGRFRQYLAVVTHAMLISVTGSLLVTPLRILQEDLLLSLHLGLFFPVDADAYAARVLRQLELFWLWGFVVMGLGVSKIDPRRGWAGSAVFLLCVAVALAMLLGLLRPPGT